MEMDRNALRRDSIRALEALDRWPPAAPTAAARRVADEAVAGRIAFYDRFWTDVGRGEIDWSGPHHGHNQWRAQLNRFYFLRELAAVYHADGGEDYAAAARDYIADWLRAHPAGAGWELAPHDNTLNLSIRVGQSHHGGWLCALPAFLGAEAFDDAFLARLVESVRCQAAYLAAHLPGNGNWRVSAADCLILAGLCLRSLPDAEALLRRGVRVLQDAWHRQVLPDGVHMERNPSYHGWMAQVFARYWQAARRLPELSLHLPVERVSAMLDYAAGSLRPDGQPSGMHDCVARRRAGEVDAPGLRALPAARERFRRAAGLPAQPPPRRQWFPHAGQALLRDGEAPASTYLTFDATTWGGGHCHRSRNTVQLYARGLAMLPDPGIFSYERSDPFGPYGKTTPPHSTCNLSHGNQQQTNPAASVFLDGPGCTLVRSVYDGGYELPAGDAAAAARVLPGGHERALFWIHDLGAVVIDTVWRARLAPPGEEPEAALPFAEANWQLAEGAAVELDAAAGRAVARWPEGTLTLLFPDRGGGSRLTLHEGEEDPPAGWLPLDPRGGRTPAPLVRERVAPLRAPDVLLPSVLLPAGAAAPAVAAQWRAAPDGRQHCLRLCHADGAVDEVHWRHRFGSMLDAVAEVRTDASLLHLRRDADGALRRAAAVGGTYLAPHAPEPRAVPGVVVWAAD